MIKIMSSFQHRVFISSSSEFSRGEPDTEMFIRSVYSPNIRRISGMKRDEIRKSLKENGEIHEHEDTIFKCAGERFIFCPLLGYYKKEIPRILSDLNQWSGSPNPTRISVFGERANQIASSLISIGREEVK